MSALLRNLISPSARFALRERAARLRQLLDQARFWKWELVTLPHRSGDTPRIVYLGRNEKRRQAMALLGIADDVTPASGGEDSTGTVFVSELPTAGALRVPQCLSVVVPLGRPSHEIMAGYDKELRRVIRRHRARYSMRNVRDEAEVRRIERDMIRAYAIARHHEGAAHIDLDTVRKLARPEFGRLDVFCADDEAVSCQLGCPVVRSGLRYWSVVRFGCPEAVFSDRKRLGETNALTDFVALEWAIENGFDYYDLGTCLARPDGGLLQWKKRRQGTLDTIGNDGYFYVQLPETGTAQFLWDSPLFSLQRGKLALHLGIPDAASDEEIVVRYRGMGFDGLSDVYLHCARPPGEQVLQKLRALYSEQAAPPVVRLVPTDRGSPACAAETGAAGSPIG